MICRYGLVTDHAIVSLRDPGTLRSRGPGVAVGARHALIHVRFVTECHRLWWNDPGQLLGRGLVGCLGP